MFLENKSHGNGLQEIAAFVMQQDPTERYNWVDSDTCAVGRWLEHTAQKISCADWNKHGALGLMNRYAQQASTATHQNGKWKVGGTYGDLQQVLRERVPECV